MWYRTGTVTVTNGQNAVTGSGAAWLSNARIGDAFVGPDGKMYEITGVSADNAMAIYPPYAGTSSSGQSYAIIPVPGYTKKLADEAADLINSYDDALQKPWNVANTPADAQIALGLGNAATKTVGTAVGNVMQVGAGGLLGLGVVVNDFSTMSASVKSGFYSGSGDSSVNYPDAAVKYWPFIFAARTANNKGCIFLADKRLYYMTTFSSDFSSSTLIRVLDSNNTAIDPNGFIKAASPIINLYAAKIELNDEAKQQNIELIVNGIGDYTITGTSGFAQEGWYIETPTDANKNVKCYTEYEQVEQDDGTFNINVKTYVPDYSTGPATAGDPCDITADRFISIRLQPLPIPEPEPAPEESPIEE